MQLPHCEEDDDWWTSDCQLMKITGSLIDPAYTDDESTRID